MSYKLGSLFDGSGGFPLSGALCGIEPVWAAEVEPYPIAVTRSRFPKMKHLGDISKINGAEIEPVDIITFGSPCQDLSVAGKRAGLKHEANGDEETTRSGLFMEAVRIIKEMRQATNGQFPRFALWENVPGAFSSNKGEDFRIVCEELIKIVEPTASMPAVPQKGWAYADSYIGDGWSLAYRVFDAQYWGVPQRRRRIHLVADFRGQCAREILFERQGLRGYFAEGRTPWQDAPANAQGSTGANDSTGETDGTGGGRQLDDVNEQNCLTPWDVQSRQIYTPDGPWFTLYAGEGGGRGYVAIPHEISHTHIIDNIGGQAEYGKETPVNGTLRAGAQGAVTYSVENHPADSRVDIDDSGKVQTLTSRMGTGGGNVPMVMEPKAIYTHPQSDTWDLEKENRVQTLSAGMGMGGGNTPLIMEPFCKSSRAKSADDVTTWKPGEVANTLNTFDQGETRANELVVQSLPDASAIDVEMEVAVRKYEVDSEKLCKCLREHKTSAKLSNREIAEKLNRPITLVEHWFRTDNSFAVPDPESWHPLKKLLNIETTEFDQSVTEFEFKAGNYDLRNRIYVGDTSPTLTCGCGDNLHLLPEEPVYCLQGNGIDRADTAGCNGKGWGEDVSYTLNTIDRPAVAYSFLPQQKAESQCFIEGVSNCLVNGTNPGFQNGIVQQADTAFLASGKDAVGTLMANAGTKQWLGNQEAFSGDYHVIEKKQEPIKYPEELHDFIADHNADAPHQQDQLQTADGVARPLVAATHGAAAHHTKTVIYEPPRYIVRRLTPTECARLQGFADRWGDIDKKDDLTDEEFRFWLEVRNTHAAINGRAVKDYTKKQMLTWYNKLQTDSAEYKMWGNGIALPPALYCLQGVVDVLSTNTLTLEDWMM